MSEAPLYQAERDRARQRYKRSTSMLLLEAPEGIPTTRWSTILSSKVNLHHVIHFALKNWSRNIRKCEVTKPSNANVWYQAERDRARQRYKRSTSMLLLEAPEGIPASYDPRDRFPECKAFKVSPTPA